MHLSHFHSAYRLRHMGAHKDNQEPVMEMEYALHQFGQKDFLPEDATKYPTYLIGAGGIGSPAAMVLSKMGLSDLWVFDPDTVEAHNVGAQLYHSNQDQERKAQALARFVEAYNPVAAMFPGPGQQLSPFSIVVSAVDSMVARKEIWDYLKTQRLLKLYVDARMGLERIRVFALDPNDAKQVETYEKVALYGDEEADPLPCSAKAVAYNGFFAASVIGGLVSAKLRGAKVPLEVIGDMGAFGLSATL